MTKSAYEMRISDWSSDVCSSGLVFMAALVMLWLASCAVAAIALYAFPGLILKPTLDHRLVMIAVGLCALLSLVQCVQTPMSVMTQARKAFRPLAAQSKIGRAHV